MDSTKWTLNQQDVQKSLHWALIFLAPLVTLYCGSVIALLQTPNHIFQLKDLIPNSYVVGGGVLYILDRVYDLFLKLKAGEPQPLP